MQEIIQKITKQEELLMYFFIFAIIKNYKK